MEVLLTLIGVHFNVKLGKEQLTKVEQPDIDIPTGSITTKTTSKRQ